MSLLIYHRISEAYHYNYNGIGKRLKILQVVILSAPILVVFIVLVWLCLYLGKDGENG